MGCLQAVRLADRLSRNLGNILSFEEGGKFWRGEGEGFKMEEVREGEHAMTALEWVAYCSLVYVVCGTIYRVVKALFFTGGAAGEPAPKIYCPPASLECSHASILRST